MKMEKIISFNQQKITSNKSHNENNYYFKFYFLIL